MSIVSTVNLTKQIITKKGRRFVPVAKGHNDRVRADWVIYEGREIYYPWGRYYLDWNANGQRHRMAAGDNATEADSKRLRKQAELNSTRHFPLAVTSKESSLGAAIEAYLKQIRQRKVRRRIENCTMALMYFQEYCHKDINKIKRIDLIRFTVWLRDERFVPSRRVWDMFGHVVSFLRANGVREFSELAEWPDFKEVAH